MCSSDLSIAASFDKFVVNLRLKQSADRRHRPTSIGYLTEYWLLPRRTGRITPQQRNELLCYFASFARATMFRANSRGELSSPFPECLSDLRSRAGRNLRATLHQYVAMRTWGERRPAGRMLETDKRWQPEEVRSALM